MSILRLLSTLELMQITLCVCLCFRWHQKCQVASEDTGGKFINFCCSASACRRPLLQQQEGVERVSQIPLSLDRWARVVQVRTDGTLAVPPCPSLCSCCVTSTHIDRRAPLLQGPTTLVASRHTLCGSIPEHDTLRPLSSVVAKTLSLVNDYFSRCFVCVWLVVGLPSDFCE